MRYCYGNKYLELPDPLVLYTDENWTFDELFRMYKPTPSYVKESIGVDLVEKYGDSESKAVISELVSKLYNYIYQSCPTDIDSKDVLEIRYAYEKKYARAIKMGILSFIRADDLTGIGSVSDESRFNPETMNTADVSNAMVMPMDVINILKSNRLIYKMPNYFRYSDDDMDRAWE